MIVVEILVCAIGIAVVLATLLSAVRTVVVPRAEQVLLVRAVFIMSAYAFSGAARLIRNPVRRDAFWARYAPISLLLMPLSWAVLVISGFAAIYWVDGVRPVRDALIFSGSSFTTLGFFGVDASADLLIATLEALLGLGLVALLLSFMPALYDAYARREALVSRLEVRAGSPSTVVGLVERAHQIDWLEELGETWGHWEQWFIEVEESHTTYPALNFFRSSRADRSWLASAGTVLDAAAFVESSVSIPSSPEAALCLRSGYLTLNRIAGYFGIPVDEHPSPSDPISITRADYDQMCQSLTAVGVPIVDDRDAGWAAFAGWRVNYDLALLGLLELHARPTLMARPAKLNHAELLVPTGV